MRAAFLAAILCVVCAADAHAAGGSSSLAAEAHVVMIQGFKYQPNVLTVHVGETVEWKNADIVPHTVTASDKSFNSGSIAPGGSWRFTAKKAGTFYYGCTPHPNMKATLIVQ